jgi:hypothetical protein
MALNITNAGPPPPLQGVEATVASGANTLPANTPPNTPPPIGASAAPVLPGVTRAGVKLAYFVLTIVTGSIVLLLLVLVWLNSSVGNDVKNAYAQVMNPTKIGSEFYILGSLESLVSDFNRAHDDEKWTMSDASVRNESTFANFLAKLPSVTSSQKSTIAACSPLPEGALRKSTLEKCITVLNDVRQAALEAAASTSDAQVAGEAVDKILAHRQALLSFWMQAAQLILLNLLLPLLTALFGYIFGTQQAQQQALTDK